MKSKKKKAAAKRRVAGWLGWHFAEESECLRYGDGRKIVVGKSHSVDCEPVLCQRGLHASKTIREALQYAPGPILYRVKLMGKVVHGDDKSCATKRYYIAKINANPILHEWGRLCALKVIDKWDCPKVVKDYLETGDENLRSAAWSAARSAAGSAAESAAWSAAESAAESAARSAAWSAAESAARSAQSDLLDKMVLSAMKKAKHK